MSETNTERAVLAGGCFWGMQDLIRKLPGVISSRVGYTGGHIQIMVPMLKVLRSSLILSRLLTDSYWSFSSRSMIQPHLTSRAMIGA